MRHFVDVGRIVKTGAHGKGFVVHCTAGLPFFLAPGMAVHFTPPMLDMPRRAIVEEAYELEGGTFYVAFRYAKPPENPLDLVGGHCVVAASDVPAWAFERPSALLAGFKAIEATGKGIGLVSEVIENPCQWLLAIMDGDEQFLLPFVDEFVHGIDPEARTVTVHVPDSLRKLNR